MSDTQKLLVQARRAVEYIRHGDPYKDVLDEEQVMTIIERYVQLESELDITLERVRDLESELAEASV